MSGASALGLLLSKDRPLQLDAALNSFLRLASEAEELRLVVLYGASSTRFASQYDQLARYYLGRVGFVAEAQFREQVLEFVSAASDAAREPGPRGAIRTPDAQETGNTNASEKPSEFVLFLVDDAMFTRPFRWREVCEALSDNTDALGYSLRLGRNTTQSYALSRRQALPVFQQLPAGVLKYNWTRADGDFGYPLEISSSVYRMEMVAKLVQSLNFKNPNTLESQMALQAGRFAEQFPALLCQEYSLAFSAPINRVQQTYRNRSGGAAKYSLHALADRFDRGQRIKVDALEGFVPTSCHEEVEILFE
jgi:hypothetical protein